MASFNTHTTAKQDDAWNEEVDGHLTGIQSVHRVRASLALARGLSLTFRNHFAVLVLLVVCLAPALLLASLLITGAVGRPALAAGLRTPFSILTLTALAVGWLGVVVFKAALTDLLLQRMDKQRRSSMVSALIQAGRNGGRLTLVALVQILLLLMPVLALAYVLLTMGPADAALRNQLMSPIAMLVIGTLLFALRLLLQFCASLVMTDEVGPLDCIARSMRMTFEHLPRALGLLVLRTALSLGLLFMVLIVILLALTVLDLPRTPNLAEVPTALALVFRVLVGWALVMSLVLSKGTEIGLMIEIASVEDGLDAPLPDRA